tara:strand:+ start:873 stop:1394 length:522 start_codon:yes stop_codon:yes gene_type:complete
MKITKNQLKQLIEGYLKEQSAIDGLDDEDASIEDEPSDETTAQPEAEAETTDTQTGDDLPKKFKSFEIIVDDVTYKIQFVKDSTLGVLKVEIDDQEIKNPTPQDFVTLAGIGLKGVSDENLKDQLSKVVKIDKSFAKFKNINALVQQVKGKLDGSREGFALSDIRKTLNKRHN